MKTLFRVFVGLALVVIAIQWYLGSDGMRRTVEGEIGRALNRDVQMADLRVSVLHAFPNLSVEIVDATVGTLGAAEPEMVIPTAYVIIPILPLFRDALVCDVEVHDAQVRVEARDDGSSSLDGLVSKAWLNEPGTFETVHLRHLTFTNSALAYRSQRGRDLGIVGIEAELSAYMSPDSSAYEGEVMTTAVRIGGGGVSRETDLASAMSLTLQTGVAEGDTQLTRAYLSVGPHVLDLSGLPIDWNSLPRLVDLALRLKDAASLPTREAIDAALKDLEEEAHRYLNEERARFRERLQDALDRATERGREALRRGLDRLLGGKRR